MTQTKKTKKTASDSTRMRWKNTIVPDGGRVITEGCPIHLVSGGRKPLVVVSILDSFKRHFKASSAILLSLIGVLLALLMFCFSLYLIGRMLSPIISETEWSLIQYLLRFCSM